MTGGDPLKKVQPGHPFRMPAAAYNAFVDAAADFQRRSLNKGGVDSCGRGYPPGIVLIRNDSGADVGQFGVLTLGGIVIDPADNEPEFRSGPVFAGIAPVAGKPLAVLQEPVASEKFGRAMIYGVTPVKLNAAAGGAGFADLISGTSATLVPAMTGPARVLWCADEGESAVWAVVCLNQAGYRVSHSWQVWLRHDAGTWKYAVSDHPPAADNTFPVEALAGSIINPNGSVTDVPVKDWEAVPAAASVQLKLSYAGLTPTPTIGIGLGSTDLAANPALLVLDLAYIGGDDTSGYRIEAEYQTSDIVFPGAMIPPAMAGYSAGDRQMVVREANGGMSLVSIGENFSCP